MHLQINWSILLILSSLKSCQTQPGTKANQRSGELLEKQPRNKLENSGIKLGGSELKSVNRKWKDKWRFFKKNETRNQVFTNFTSHTLSVDTNEVITDNLVGGIANGWVASCFDKICRYPWRDIAGKRIEAHGGGLLVHDGVYFWYGESAKILAPAGYGYSEGISCYSARYLGGP